MDPIVHAKQKVITRQVGEIADDIEKRLGLETRLHRLCIENLDQPECAIGIYTPRGHLIGEIEVRLHVADCKAKVTSALFRDLEDAVDDWTFDLTGKSNSTTSAESRSPQSLCVDCGNQVEDAYNGKRELCATCYAGTMKVDETASAELFVPVAMECRNESCPEKLWVTRSPEATKCPSCGVESTIVRLLRCPNSGCMADWDPQCYPEHRRTCPWCGTEGVPVARPKSNRMRCTNLGCATREWDGDGHEVEMCPGCKERGSPVDDDMTVRDETASAEPFRTVPMACLNQSCEQKTWIAKCAEATKCPMCRIEGSIIRRLTCPNPKCMKSSWQPQDYLSYLLSCPLCKCGGVPVLTTDGVAENAKSTEDSREDTA